MYSCIHHSCIQKNKNTSPTKKIPSSPCNHSFHPVPLEYHHKGIRKNLTEHHPIVKACISGDRQAQRQLYEQMKDKMFVLALRYADNRQDAEDILQEGFVKVFRDLHQYKGLGSLEGWIRKVILNVALKHIKQKRRDFFIEPIGENDFKDEIETESFFSDDLIKNVLAMMQQMPAGFRTVLNLYILEGYSHQQIAAELNISVGTSKSQFSRAKQHLRALLDKSLTR
jgi:RNA polymerase sigma factor (sigma-70 family)